MRTVGLYVQRWGVHGQTTAATMDVPDPHIRANQFSAISNTGKVHFMTYLGTLNSALFLTFLDRLLRNTTGKVFLIVDQLRAHKTPEVSAPLPAGVERGRVCEQSRTAGRSLLPVRSP